MSDSRFIAENWGENSLVIFSTTRKNINRSPLVLGMARRETIGNMRGECFYLPKAIDVRTEEASEIAPVTTMLENFVNYQV